MTFLLLLTARASAALCRAAQACGRRLQHLMLVLAVLLPLPATATVLQALDLDALVTESRLIFIGEVLQHQVEAADGLVYTHVRFRVDELISGEAPDQEFSLRFVGGSSAGTQVEVSGQYIPAPGTRALWFVSDPYAHLVNPLTGWHQGVFPVVTAADGEQLLDLTTRPDLVLNNTRADPLARKMLQTGFSEDRIAARVADYQRFPLRDFVDAIRSLTGELP